MLARDCMAMKQQQRDLDRKLNANDQIQVSSVYDGEESWTKTHICVEVACIVLCTMVVLVLALVKIKINDMKHSHMEDYTLCNNRAKSKPSTAMKVVGIKYTKP